MNTTTQTDHVTELLNKTGFEGVDISKDISLFEYGFVWHEPTDTLLYVAEWQGVEEPRAFELADFNAEILKDICNEDWVNIEAVAQFAGMTVSEWHEGYILHQLHDLLLYYGYANIFGSSYHPLSWDELVEHLEQIA